MPCDIVRFPCGSMSTQRTRWPSSTKAAARLSVVVVLATPPFWLAKAMTLALPVTGRLLGSGGRTIGPRFAPARRSPSPRGAGPVRRRTLASDARHTGGRMIGLAHVATVSFLASRAAPSLQFFFALGGGISLARASYAGGARAGHGASLAAMLQTIAVMGPARVNAPLTQAITAPMMGRLQARGAGVATEFLACLTLRLIHYAVRARGVHLDHPRRPRRVRRLVRDADGLARDHPAGRRPRRSSSCSLGQVVWAVFFSAVQVVAYRRALRDWPPSRPPSPRRSRRRSGASAARSASTRARSSPPRSSPPCCCSPSHSWLLLAGVTLWLDPGVAALAARPRRGAARARARGAARLRRAHRRAAQRRRPRAHAPARRARGAARRRRDLDARRRRPGRAARGLPPDARARALRSRPCARRSRRSAGSTPGRG